MELRPGALVVFGELHGTIEVPAFVATLLDQPHAVVLGIEWPAELQRAVDAFVDSAIDRASLIATPSLFWSWRDGRSSEAMVELLAVARAWRARGRAIRVACFDGVFASGDDRERGMARALLAALDPRAVNLALCGNIHAGTSSPAHMGWHVREREPAHVALNLAAVGGTAWCVLRDREPGIAEFRGPIGAPAGIACFDRRDANGYDGELVLPRITASPPVA